MKLKSATLVTLALALVLLACEKNGDHQVPPTKILTPEEILVKQAWQIDEVWRAVNGKNSHYIKGVENTTGVLYERLRITFTKDGKGTYTDENNLTHSLTWSFTSADKKNMQINVGPPAQGGGNFVWHLVEISENSLTNTTAVGSSVLVSARYIPVSTATTTSNK